MWMQAVLLMLCGESSLLASSKYGAKETAWAFSHRWHIKWCNNTGSDVMALGERERAILCDKMTWHDQHKLRSISTIIGLHCYTYSTVDLPSWGPIWVTAFPRATPSPLRILRWAACLTNDECFLCHRSAKNKKPAKKDSVMVSVNVSLWFFQLITLTPSSPPWS